jgi:hypothetical protein
MYTGLRCNNLAQQGVPKRTNCDVGCLLLHVKRAYLPRSQLCVLYGSYLWRQRPTWWHKQPYLNLSDEGLDS